MSTAINDYLLREGGRVSPNVTQKMMGQASPWINLYPQESWLEQTSAIQKTFQFDRAQLLADEVPWTNVTRDPGSPPGQLADQEAPFGYAIPLADEVIFTQTNRSFQLQSKGIWGPRINTNDLRDVYVRNQQMQATTKALADQSREIWIKRKRVEYKRIASRKVILDANFVASMSTNREGTTLFPKLAVGGDAATGNASILTGGHLDYIYEYMNHQGAADGALGTENNRPIFAFVTSGRASRRVITENADKRSDFHFSDRNAELLAPMGVKLQLNGWSHIIDDKINRFHLFATGTDIVTAASKYDSAGTAAISSVGVVTLSGTAPISGTKTITVGSEFITAAGNKYIVASVPTVAVGSQYTTFNVVTEAGSSTCVAESAGFYNLWIAVPMFAKIDGKIEPNPEWLAAGWEDGYVFHQKMCTSLVPSPITSVGGAQFDSVKYSGEFSWKNFPDETKNPDGTVGRFRGVLMSGTRPDNPDFGVVVRYRVGSGDFGAVTDWSTLG